MNEGTPCAYILSGLHPKRLAVPRTEGDHVGDSAYVGTAAPGCPPRAQLGCPSPNSLQPSRPAPPLKDMLLRSALPAKRRLSPPPKPDTLNVGRLYV
jgi:hypothetical protein